MTLAEIYDLVINAGIDADPRSRKIIEKKLSSKVKDFQALSGVDKDVYDKEMLTNPYADTRILYGDLDTSVKSIFVGIDIETPELILAQELKRSGRKIDLVMAHHPEGVAFAGLHQVMEMQADIFHDAGVPINVAEGIMADRINEIGRATMPANKERSIDAARLLSQPFMCVHSPADNQVATYLTDLMAAEQPDTLGDIIDLLMGIPEYNEYAKLKSGPNIFIGSKNNSAGKIILDMTGGTGTSNDMYQALSAAGVGTIIGMHMSDKSKEQAAMYHINVVIAGHLASDSLGMNLLLDQLEDKGIEIIPASGLIRIRR